MNIIRFIVKLWFKLPRFKFFINIKKYYLDERSYYWYLQRRKYGFDEQSLSKLSSYVESIIKIRLGFPKTHIITSGDFKAWIMNNENKEDLIWFLERVEKYREWECPYTIHVSKYIEDRKVYIDSLLAKYIMLLKHRINGGNLVDAEVNFLHKHNLFQWSEENVKLK